MPSLFAQDATVTGIVTDSADAVAPGVAIKIRNTETNDTRSCSDQSRRQLHHHQPAAGPVRTDGRDGGIPQLSAVGHRAGDRPDPARPISNSRRQCHRVRPRHRRGGRAQYRKRRHQGRRDRAAGDQRPAAGRPRLHRSGVPGARRDAGRRAGRDRSHPSTARAPTPPISTSMASTTATRAAPPPRCGRTWAPCRSSRWKSPATPPRSGAWPAAS